MVSEQEVSYSYCLILLYTCLVSFLSTLFENQYKIELTLLEPFTYLCCSMLLLRLSTLDRVNTSIGEKACKDNTGNIGDGAWYEEKCPISFIFL